MNLLRNKEVKRHILILLVVAAAAAAGGAFISPACAAYVLGICIISDVIYMVFARNRYIRSARLSEKIDLLLHGEERVDFSSFQEGEFAILSTEIDKMSIRLREQAGALVQEKQYLQKW